MCEGCGCSRPSTPSSAGSVGPVVSCAGSQSEILVVDEIGLPFGNTAVRLRISGTVHNTTTDASGKICLSVPPGTAVKVELADTQEAQVGDSTATSSGQHFAAGGTGP